MASTCSAPHLFTRTSFSLPLLSPSLLRLSSVNKDQKKSGSRNYKHKRAISLSCHAQLLADVASATSAAYGALLLGGGLFAYSRSRSKGSILGGVSGASLMGVAYYLMQSPETKEIGEAIGFGSAFIFSSIFGIRLAATGKFIPSGLLLSISVGAMAVFFSAYTQAKV